MKHEDLMIFHRIKYKHIGILLVVLGAISTYWTVDPTGKTMTAMGIYSLTSCILLFIGVIAKLINNWDDEIL